MWSFLIQVLISILVIAGKNLPVRRTLETGSCSKSNHGEMILVKDRKNKDAIIVCTENNEVFSWRKTDNSKPLGEHFDPGYDCLDILKHDANSKDGFYWITLNGNVPKRVYCDMTTDGGGYILVGYMNDTVTWNVPSNNETVEPFGDPHWSSEFGDLQVIDFRIQVSSDDDFENTKAHWAFRFQNKRSLKNLMIVNQGGCPYNFPGVGDILHVKDLMTGGIVGKHFPCSIFGAYYHPLAKIGWTMMNSCLDKSCPNGFAYHPVFPVQVVYSGGFSFVAGEGSRASTAFFGCDMGKCCACYGPRGGRNVYCLKGCQATNGGTITKHASAWFWVRSNPPRKVKGKCMEYQIEDENGDSGVWYKLVGDDDMPVKGRCGNEGIVGNNDDSIKSIGAADGFLAYNTTDESLLFRKNNTWKALAEKDELLQMKEQLRWVTKHTVDIFLNHLGRMMCNDFITREIKKKGLVISSLLIR
ncbi:uncharacterized protein LOC114526068 isoform X2 [Dendronephthya gigantea]|uniref:uncharacterized protein LOC114526068 isoform X2 n=1 Tax=Dendronephthya gigantea TaxID=151771 RepID=UPI00106998EC|nr:uncharacterized protein LOC114526068 isoform X2 [Dendronephthya gigantea]